MRQVLAAVCVMVCVAMVATAGEPITIGETVKLQSKIMGEERTILISTPANYARSQERYPVLYMTDGAAHLSHTRGTVDFLAGNGLISNLIIVGINNTDRTRDLTPTRDTRPDASGKEVEVPNSGGGDRFLDFFARELIPYVEANYRTAPYRVFAGHSFGGLLALHILATRPDMFGALIAASPSLNWDKEYPTRVVESLLKSRKELSRTLFVSMGNEEDGEGHPNRLERLEAILKVNRPAGFVWETKLMADEDHGSVVLRSHYWGLRRVFDGWRMPLDVRRGEGDVVAAVKTHYAALSRRMGYEVLPPEGTVNQLGYQVLGRGKVEDAITVFRYNVELYPASANVHDSLGEALERAGRKEEALASYGRAVQNATATGDPLLEVFTRNRDRLSK